MDEWGNYVEQSEIGMLDEDHKCSVHYLKDTHCRTRLLVDGPVCFHKRGEGPCTQPRWRMEPHCLFSHLHNPFLASCKSQSDVTRAIGKMALEVEAIGGFNLTGGQNGLRGG
eukprot:4166336-Amphidinium_carterae.1